MKELITKPKLKKLIASKPIELVDKDKAYFTISEELEIDLCVDYFANFQYDIDGFPLRSTFTLNITNVTIDCGSKWIPVNFTKYELNNLDFNGDVIEEIKELFLED